MGITRIPTTPSRSSAGQTNKLTRRARSTRLEMYDWIKNQNGVASVADARGNKARVGGREHANGTKYVQTYADRIWTDNLLALPECR